MKIKVIRGDAWVECAALKAASVPLIVTDPPYGKILNEDWDRKWSIEDYEALAHVIERLGASSRWPRSDLPARPALRVAHGQEQHRALPRVRHRGEEPAPPAALNVSRVS